MPNRRLAAIMFADIVGYTAMMQHDESKGLAKVRRFNRAMESEVEDNEGEILHFLGDGCLCIFHSAVQAMHAAKGIQQKMLDAPSIPLRIGIHIGDIVFTEGSVYGDGVNLAARVESMGVPGSVLVTEQVIPSLKSHPEFEMASLGKFQFKNVDQPMEVFALANEGFVVPKRTNMKGKGTPIPSLKLNYTWLIACIGVILLALSIPYSFRSNQVPTKISEKSIAILPFENLNLDSKTDYFSDGISQDILTNLSGIKDLQVISFNSSKRYKENPKSSQEIGSELGVKHLLTGSVQQRQDELVIRAMLIDTETDRQLWAKRYEKKIADIFRIQAEVSYEIVEILKAELVPTAAARINQQPTESIEAWQEYSQGRYHWELRTEESLLLAEQFFKKAIELDEDFALAYAGLALTYQVLGTKPDQDQALSYLRSKDYAEKAIALNPDIADAYAVLGGFYFWHDVNFPKSIKYFQSAISLEPGNETAHQWYAEALLGKGDIEGARAEVDIAKRLDPSSRIIRFVESNVLMGEDNYEAAIQILDSLYTQDPGVFSVRWFLAETYLYTGQIEKAMSIKGLQNNQDGFPYSYLFETHQVSALESWNDLHPGSGWFPYRTQNDLYILSGNLERYVERMDSAFFFYRFMDPGTFQYYPPHDSIRLHPAFQALMQKGNFTVRPRAEVLEIGLGELRNYANEITRRNSSD